MSIKSTFVKCCACLSVITIAVLTFGGHSSDWNIHGRDVRDDDVIVVSSRSRGDDVRVVKSRSRGSRPRTLRGMFERYSELYRVPGVNCTGVFERDKETLEDALEKVKLPEWQGFITNDTYFLEVTQDCDSFIHDHGYITSSLSEQEKHFPLAYSMVVFKDIEPVERLLRAIYRPQNVYCIHVDKETNPNFFLAVEAIASCFPNVFLTEKRIDVVWGQFSVLEADLICMRELWERSRRWKYFINLTGQEYPLKTNRELVEILTAYRGASEVEGVRKQSSLNRWDNFLPAPLDLTPTQGAAHVVISREFVNFALNDPRAKVILNWLKPQFAAEETFFSTIHHNPQLGVEGSFIGLTDYEQIVNRKLFYGRYKAWKLWPCAGRRVRLLCILSTGDLYRMHHSGHFFANKFYLNEDRLAYGCLEQRLFNRTRDLALSDVTVDTHVYERSATVRHRLVKAKLNSSLVYSATPVNRGGPFKM